MVEVAGFEVDIPREFLDGIFFLRLPSPNPRSSYSCDDGAPCFHLCLPHLAFYAGVDVPDGDLHLLTLRVLVPVLELPVE